MSRDLGALPPSITTAIPGPRSRALVDVLARTECPSLTARRARREEVSGAPQDPIVWTTARGANVLDADGNVLVDLTAGFGAASIGHAHPSVVRAVREQSERLMHALGDVHPSDVKIELCERLAGLAPFPDARVMLGAHGGDAIEAALKTAMLASRRAGALAFDGGYHGLSHGPLAISGYAERMRAPFAPQLNPHVVFEAYGASMDRIEARLADRTIGCVVVEPILGRGGVVTPPHGWLASLGRVAHDHGALLIVDEIMTGLGRTGVRFAFEREGVVPDIVCLGKALGGGMPISACIAPHEVMKAWGSPDQESIHTATFFGQPIACAAALAALDVIDEEALIDRAASVGAELATQLSKLASTHRSVREVRGRGLLLGVVMRPMAALRVGAALLTKGFITLPAANDASVLSLTPPLTIARAQIDAFVAALDDVLAQEDAS
jgi:4-aminobutyrate aminotransferase/(S)-3-amino-2-methylpropionate transaminase